MLNSGSVMSESAPSNQVRGRISPYTLAMARCLASAEESAQGVESCGVHQLTNLVQGRMLEFLGDEICRRHGIADPEWRSQIVTALLGIFSDEFFALFRSKLEKRPDLAVLIARRIIRGEFEACEGGDTARARRSLDRLFPAIFRKYFEYRDLDSLLHIVETDAKIQKTLFLVLLRSCIQGESQDLYREVSRILSEDAEGLCPNLFREYVTANRIDQLQQRIQSGDWRKDRENLRQRIATICGR
jgi:hypothetical protein